MQQNWSIRVRAHECSLTGRAFEDGEFFHTAIYFDPGENGYVRKDICSEAWKERKEERKPVAAWKSMYQKVLVEARPEITPKESAMELLQRFIEDGDPLTENARYILALMLERKRQISQTAEKEVDGNKMLFYENKKTGEIFIVRDPELRLDEVAQIQDEVATILAFGGPAADAAKAVGVTLTPDGVVPSPDHADPVPEAAAATPADEPSIAAADGAEGCEAASEEEAQAEQSEAEPEDSASPDAVAEEPDADAEADEDEPGEETPELEDELESSDEILSEVEESESATENAEDKEPTAP